LIVKYAGFCKQRKEELEMFLNYEGIEGDDFANDIIRGNSLFQYIHDLKPVEEEEIKVEEGKKDEEGKMEEMKEEEIEEDTEDQTIQSIKRSRSTAIKEREERAAKRNKAS